MLGLSSPHGILGACPFHRVYLTTATLAWLVPLLVLATARLRNRLPADSSQALDDAVQNDAAAADPEETEALGDSGTPWWFPTRLRQEGASSSHTVMVLVYIWSLGLLAAVVWFGYRQLRLESDLYRVCVAMAVLANAAFMNMMLVGGLEGGVQIEGPELEELGFYGQFGVMMFLTNVFVTVFASVYAALFWSRARRQEVIRIDIDESDYKIHEDDPDEEKVMVS